jgi:serine/threonine-protein kinase
MAPETDRLASYGSDNLEPTRSAERRIGTIIAGSYRLTRHIGSGGSSHIFEAEHLRLGKPFAVKLLRPELNPNRRTAQRFRREARAIARLKSEHIVSVVDCGELNDGTPYLVMELLEGEDLRSVLNRESSLPTRRAVPLIIEACRGLTEVHAAGLVHRDLKPENLFITRRSTGEDWCKVLDFGVAKMDASQSTAEGTIVGTVRYMAPEQLTDSTAVAAATDVYALGAILYECLTGRALIEGSTVQEVMYRIMNAEPAPLKELVPMLPRALAEVIERCLCKSPAGRPSNAAELAPILEAAIAASPRRATTTATSTEDDKPAAPVPRRRATRPLMVGVLAATLGSASVLWYTSSASPAQEGPQLSFPIARSPAARDMTPPASAYTAPAPLEAPLPSASGKPSGSSAPATPSSIKPPIPGPRPATWATPRSRPVNGFDSANPYAE